MIKKDQQLTNATNSMVSFGNKRIKSSNKEITYPKFNRTEDN